MHARVARVARVARIARHVSEVRSEKQISISRMALSISKSRVPNLNVAEPKDLSPSMRKLQKLREHILTPGVANGLHDFIVELYDGSDIEEELNKSYKVADEFTNLCIEVVQQSDQSAADVIKIIDVLIAHGADINRWNTASGKYSDHAENALTWAVTHSKGRIVQHLIQKGADASDSGDHSDILAHFAGHLSPRQRRKIRRALGGRTPTSAASSRMGSEGGAPGARGSGGGGGGAAGAPIGRSHHVSGSGGGAGGGAGIPKGTRSRGASISKRKTRKQK